MGNRDILAEAHESLQRGMESLSNLDMTPASDGDVAALVNLRKAFEVFENQMVFGAVGRSGRNG